MRGVTLPDITKLKCLFNKRETGKGKTRKMKKVQTKRHSIHVGKCGGLDVIASSRSIRLIQCTKVISNEFEFAGFVRGDNESLYDVLEEYDLWEVSSRDIGGDALMIGEKIGETKKRFRRPDSFEAIIAVNKSVDKSERFSYAIDYISKINMSISDTGYMAVLVDDDLQVLEAIDHIPDEEDLDEIIAYLYRTANKLEHEITPSTSLTIYTGTES